MDALRLPSSECKRGDTLSGGEKRRRCHLCRLFFYTFNSKEPECAAPFWEQNIPTTVDAESVHWLESICKTNRKGTVRPWPDRYYLDNVAGWILRIGSSEGFLGKELFLLAGSESKTAWSRKRKTEFQVKKLGSENLNGIWMNSEARQAKGKASIECYDKLSGRVQRKRSKVGIFISPDKDWKQSDLRSNGVSPKLWTINLLFENLSFSLPQGGASLELSQPNGAGKTHPVKIDTQVRRTWLCRNFEVGETVTACLM